MSKPEETLRPMIITDPEEGREYTLEFNRKTVKKAEQNGLDINQIGSQSMTMISNLFWSAFLMHHPNVTHDQADKILFDGLGGLSAEELEYLGKLYAAPYRALISDEGEERNPRKMTVKF